MAGATLYGRAELSALFVNEPFLRSVDGRWRVANPLKRPWEGTPQIEGVAGSRWEPVAATGADVAVGAVRVEGTWERLRGRGRFFPLTFLGEAAGWRLDAGFTGGARSFGGRIDGGKLAGATVVLQDCDLASGASLAGPLYVLLEAGGGEYACLAARASAGDSREVRLSVGPDGLAFSAH